VRARARAREKVREGGIKRRENQKVRREL